MTTVNYSISTCSDTGLVRHHINSIQTTDRTTFCEVFAQSLDLELDYPPCPISKLVLCVKVSLRLKVDLYNSTTHVARMNKTVNCDQENVSVTLVPDNTKSVSNKAKVHIEQTVEETPIRIVFVLLQTEQREGEASGDSVQSKFGPGASFYNQGSAGKREEERKTDLKRPAPSREPIKPAKAVKVDPRAQISASPPSISYHLPLDQQPITSPYDHALEGTVVSALAEDPDLVESIPAMVEAMGGLFMSELDEMVQVVVVDHSLSQEELERVKRCSNAVVVGWPWLQACQEECGKVDPTLYQTD